MTSAEYRQALGALPYGKRLPSALYLVDPGDDASIPSLLRVTVAELRKRLEIGFDFNLLKLRIERIMHGARDLPNRLREDPEG